MATERVYPEGILGKKIGMTQIFTDEGKSVPVTVIQAGPCHVVQIKDTDKDGYTALQLGFDEKKAQRIDKAQSGHFAKGGKGGFYHLKEIRCDESSLKALVGEGELKPGMEVVPSNLFEEGDFLDVSGVTKGKGFQGVVRRFGVRGAPATRGTHEKRRNIGSIGCRKSPGRVWKNKKMPGHMGTKNVTTQNLRLMKVIPEQNVILVKGAVPSAKNGLVVVRKARKKGLKK